MKYKQNQFNYKSKTFQHNYFVIKDYILTFKEMHDSRIFLDWTIT